MILKVECLDRCVWLAPRRHFSHNSNVVQQTSSTVQLWTRSHELNPTFHVSFQPRYNCCRISLRAYCRVLPPDPRHTGHLSSQFHNDCCNVFPYCCHGNERTHVINNRCHVTRKSLVKWRNN